MIILDQFGLTDTLHCGKGGGGGGEKALYSPTTLGSEDRSLPVTGVHEVLRSMPTNQNFRHVTGYV